MNDDLARTPRGRLGAGAAAVLGAALFAFGCVAEVDTEELVGDDDDDVEETQEASSSLMPVPNFACKLSAGAGVVDTCSGTGVVTPQVAPAGQRRVEIDLDAKQAWKTFVLRVRVCDSTGWTVHVGDSPTNNGYGGDGSSTSHDAEAQALNGGLTVWRSDVGSGSYLMCDFGGPPSTAGCVIQDWVVQNDTFRFDPNTESTLIPMKGCYGSALFDFPSYDEADAEDPTCKYADKLYVGLNRVYQAGSDRVGTGVQTACFFLSGSSTYDPAAVSSYCGSLNPPVPLVAPSYLWASWNSSPDLQWDDSSVGEEGYSIERRSAGQSWIVIGATGPDETFFTDTSAYPSIDPLYYRVRAFAGGAFSGYSPEAIVGGDKADIE